jgi:lysophospholipase L1-like esterase
VTTFNEKGEAKQHTVPPELKPGVAGVHAPSGVTLPSLCFKNHAEAGIRIENVYPKFASELARQRYAPSFAIVAIGANEACDITLTVLEFKNKLMSLALQLPHAIRERLSNWSQPYSVFKIVFVSLPQPPDLSLFNYPSVPLKDRVADLNAAIKAVAEATGNLYYDCSQILDGKTLDRYRIPIEFDAYHPSAKSAQEISIQVAKLIYSVIVPLTPAKGKKRRN